jgi:hypothetical protein
MRSAFELNRARDGRYACDTANIVGYQDVLNRLCGASSFRLASSKRYLDDRCSMGLEMEVTGF